MYIVYHTISCDLGKSNECIQLPTKQMAEEISLANRKVILMRPCAGCGKIFGTKKETSRLVFFYLIKLTHRRRNLSTNSSYIHSYFCLRSHTAAEDKRQAHPHRSD